MEKFKVNNLTLAKAIGVSHVAIGNFVGGQLPKTEHLVGLADYFGCSTDWLLGRERNEAEAPRVLRESPVPFLPTDLRRKNAVAKLRRQMQNLQSQITSINEALNELEK
jgi:transcriptional regulator with XRE-family HTH domain